MMKRRDFVKSIPILAVAPAILSHVQIEKVHVIAIGTAASRLISQNSDVLKIDSITLITDTMPQGAKNHCDWIQYIPPASAYEVFDGRRFLKKEIPMQLELSDQIKQRLDNLKGRIILVAALGRFTGTFLYSPIRNYLDSKDLKSEGLCSLPFAFEGNFWREASIQVANRLQVDQRILDFEQLRSRIGNLAIRSAFRKADDWVLEELRRKLG